MPFIKTYKILQGFRLLAILILGPFAVKLPFSEALLQTYVSVIQL